MNYLVYACENSGVLSVISFIKTILNTVCILVPILLIIMLSIDLLKMVMSGEDKEIKTNSKKMINRCIGAVVIFFIPTIVSLIMGNIENFTNDYSVCWEMATTENIKFYKTLEEAREKEKAEANAKKKEEAKKNRETLKKARDEMSKKAEEDAKKKEEGNAESITGTAQTYKDVVWDPNDLTRISNLSSDQLKKVINSLSKKEAKAKNYEPFASDLIKAEQQYGVNVFALIGIETLESGWYNSPLARNCNNLGGVVATDNPCSTDPMHQYYKSKGDFINKHAKLLGNSYLKPSGPYYKGKTLKAIRPTYCPSCTPDWERSCESIGSQFFSHVKKVM